MEAVLAAPLVPHAGEIARGIEQRAGVNRLFGGGEAAEIVEEANARPRPSLADEVEFLGTYMREIEAGANGEGGKARVVLHAAQALLRNGEEDFSIAGDARGRIVHLRVVDPKGNHAVQSAALAVLGLLCAPIELK